MSWFGIDSFAGNFEWLVLYVPVIVPWDSAGDRELSLLTSEALRISKSESLSADSAIF